MNKEVYEKSISTGELQLDGLLAYFTHFSIVFFFIVLTLVAFVTTIVMVFNGAKGVFQGPVPIVILLTGGLAVLSFRMQKRRLKFRVITASSDLTQLKNIIDQVGHKLEWQFESVSEYGYIARTYPGGLSGSWGEQITILFYKDKVLVNSICDPEKHTSLVSFGRNRENEEVLINAIHTMQIT